MFLPRSNCVSFRINNIKDYPYSVGFLVDGGARNAYRALFEFQKSFQFASRPMSRVCELTGTRPITGNNVSHSVRRTKRRFLPNLVNVTLHSDTLNQNFKMRIAAKALRTVDKLGGLDAFLAKAKPEQLSDRAAKIKRDLEKKAAEATA